MATSKTSGRRVEADVYRVLSASDQKDLTGVDAVALVRRVAHYDDGAILSALEGLVRKNLVQKAGAWYHVPPQPAELPRGFVRWTYRQCRDEVLDFFIDHPEGASRNDVCLLFTLRPGSFDDERLRCARQGPPYPSRAVWAALGALDTFGFIRRREGKLFLVTVEAATA